MLKSIFLAIFLASSTISAFTTLNSNVSSVIPTANHNITARTQSPRDQVVKEFTRLDGSIANLENEVNNFPEEKPTFSQATNLNNAFHVAIRNLNAIRDGVKVEYFCLTTLHFHLLIRLTKALGSISEADSQEILRGAQKAEPTFDSAMVAFIAKKHALQRFPLEFEVATAHQNLISLLKATIEAYNEIVFACTDSVTCGLCQAKKRIHSTMMASIKAIAPA
ncbi:hypothetical protein ONZ45_g8747 [Pleurotus djamor]|nr:hypothetical protein ONZ45_g8747 [Pleurotus djamor]